MLKRFILSCLLTASFAAFALQIADRPGKASKGIMIFSQLQTQYGDFQNFLHYWKDRPLYVNPAHRYKGNNFSYSTEPSVLKHFELAKSYNIAGLSPLSDFRTIKPLFDTLEKYQIKNFMIMPAVYLPGPIPSSAAKDHVFHAILKRAIESPYSFRINGKVVVNSYASAGKGYEPEKVKAALERARKAVGNDFLYVCDVGSLIQNYYQYYYDTNRHNLDPARLKALMDKLQEYMDVCDGLYLSYTGRHFTYADGGEYGSKVDEEFLDYIRPAYLELYSRPQNQGKVLGMQCALGYVNHFTGMVNAQEYGSQTFRITFENALAMNPDFVTAFEWNEWNENTCFQPSVYKGSGYRRMIRYYQSQVDKNIKLTPLPGDDLSIPNMLFSYRYAFKLGELMRFEMLNIPDGGDVVGDYKAQIILKDLNGKVVHTMEEVTIKGDVFKDVTQTLPSEQFADHQVLVPELHVIDSKGKKHIYTGNLYIRFVPTENRIFQYVRMALREAAEVKVEKFTVTPNADGSYRVQGKVISKDPMASVELLDNRDEIRALGEDKPEFDQNKMVIIQMTASAISRKDLRLNGKVEFENVSHCIARSAHQDGNNENFWFNVTPMGIDYQNSPVWGAGQRTFFAIPRAEVDKAVLRGKLTIGEFNIPIAQLMKLGTMAVELEPCCHFRFDRFEVQPDIPVRLNKKEVAFDVNVFSDMEFPIYHLRVITEEGKLFRSKPLQIKKPSGEKVELPLWSEALRKIVKVQVAKDRIPDINYIFKPDAGAMLLNTWAPRFNGEIGCGYRYCQPMMYNHFLPKNCRSAAAIWAKDENGADILRFNGKSSNVTFEPEMFPRGAFTLEFEFKPVPGKDMVLFRHSSTNPGSLGTFIKGGKLHMTFLLPTLNLRTIPTWLKVKPGQWNKLKIVSNISRMTVELNGETQSVNNIGIGGAFRAACFGGPIKNYGCLSSAQMFEGDLRKLRVYHNWK